MKYLPIVLLAYALNAVAVTIDKFLITKKIPDPIIYIFYFSVISIAGIFFIPFTPPPSFTAFILSASYMFLWLGGAYFLLKGLKIGQVARVVPVIGTFIPILLLIQGVLTGTINTSQVIAILFLTLGLVFLTVFDWRGAVVKKEIIYELLSAIFFASAYLILRQAYSVSNFVTVLVYSHLSIIPLAILFLIIPKTRRMIIPGSGKNPKVDWKSFFSSKTSLIFGFGQLCAGISELLLTFSISLASPALVNSLQGTQFVFLLFLNLILSKIRPTIFKESLSIKALGSKLVGILAIGFGLYLLSHVTLN